MIRGRDFVILSSIDWGFLWQGPQEIATRLARAGHRVLYVENTGIRSPRWQDAARVRNRLSRYLRGTGAPGVGCVEERLWTYSPLVLPPFGPRWRRELNRRVFLPRVRDVATRVGLADPVIWSFLPTDTACELLRLLRSSHSVCVYYCAADFLQLTPNPCDAEASEGALLRSCDLAFAICRELRDRCALWCPDAHIFPYGVDLEAFPVSLTEACPPPLDALPRPVIGYSGGLHRHVDLSLVTAMARERPGWSWVFVGPRQRTTAELERLPNVRVLGQRSHGELHRYLAAFDVCIVPYAKNAFTRTVVPAKIGEYLAMGRPVVSTDLPPVLDFNEENGGVLITSVPEAGSFLAGVERALGRSWDAAEQARRRAIAERAEWGVVLRRMLDLIERRRLLRSASASRDTAG